VPGAVTYTNTPIPLVMANPGGGVTPTVYDSNVLLDAFQ
jgi:hypothetical protein